MLTEPDLLSRTDTETVRYNLWNVLLVMAAIFQRNFGCLRRPGIPWGFGMNKEMRHGRAEIMVK